MGDRTPPSNGSLVPPRRRSRVRVPPVNRVPGVRRNIMRALNNAARGNNNSDHNVPNHQRPDYIPDPNQARGGGEDLNKDKSVPVQPELKF
jgi:hypothetical protein